MTVDLHGSLQLALIKRYAAHSVHARCIEWISPELISFQPKILRLHEMSLSGVQVTVLSIQSPKCEMSAATVNNISRFVKWRQILTMQP